MAIIWKGPGCLLLNGRQLVKPGDAVAEGALTAERISALKASIEIKRPLAVVVQPPAVVSRPAVVAPSSATASVCSSVSSVAVPVSPLPASVPVSTAPFGKRGTDRGLKAGPKDR